MSTKRRVSTSSEIRRTLHARKWAQGKNRVLCVLGVFVTFGVAALLMQNVMAAKSKVRVLECPVTTAVAHHHNADCYDENGELVCTLPERELHEHTDACYERQLVCGMEEGEGAHIHDENCYDKDGKLTCKLEESLGHEHTDECYADVLVCGKEEITEEHVHGDGCFHMVAVGDDAEQTEKPEQSFTREIVDDDNNTILTVDVASPEGALPEGTTMEAELVNNDDIDRDALQSAVDEKAAKLETLEPGKVLDFHAVDIVFRDDKGDSIEPTKDVTVKLTSELCGTEDGLVLMHVADKKDDKDQAKVEVVDMLSRKQLIRRGDDVGDCQIAFDTTRFSTYVLATTSISHDLTVSDGEGTEVKLSAPAEAGIPMSAGLKVTEINRAEDDYDGYIDRTASATNINKDDIGLARFFDISIVDADEQEIQPQATVDVEIKLPDVPEPAEGFKLVHFAEDEDGNQAETPDEIIAGGENGTTTFSAESFSVYGIVYTVDFGYEVGDKVYEFSINGGTVGVAEVVDKLHVYENAPEQYGTVEKFVEGIKNVEFSSNDLLLPKLIDERTSVSQLIENDGLDISFSENLTSEEREEALAKEYEHEWVLISLKPFLTTEVLTVTMADDTQYLIKVTDAQGDVPGDYNNQTGFWDVATINNPGNTTIDLFNYWTSYSPEQAAAQNRTKRELWRGHHWGSDYQYDNINGLSGGGNWDGINANHDFKFTPANGGTVWNGTDHNNSNSDGNGQPGNADNRNVNDYTGSAIATQGLVSRQLDGAGFPVLSGQRNAGTESLKYLFDDTTDTDGSAQGKRTYKNVNQLLYLDTSDGYYTFDSRDVKADFVPDQYGSGVFKERRWTSGEQGEARGFWPFGDGDWWLGMHVNTQFLMPQGGQVAGKNNTLNDMEFMFSGDDDAWVYIDGVLIGDAGGIHNRTQININFKTGAVTVTATEGGNHSANWTRSTSLRQIFTDVKGADWVNAHFDGDSFLPNSTHVFDFFYIERGGGESNLYLSYNLLTTTDFSAKKNWVTEKDGVPLEQNKFHFYLLGLDGRINEAGDGYVQGKESEPPLMPYASPNGAGTVESPRLVHTIQEIDDGRGGKVMFNLNAFETGNKPDGTITFGTAQVSEELKQDVNDYYDHINEPDHGGYTLPKYNYVVMEKVPPNAVNAEGVTWEKANLIQRKNGGFYDGEILYDGTVYYMQCTLVREPAKDPVTGDPVTDSAGRSIWEYKIQRKFYADSYYQTEIPMTLNDMEFTNSYIEPVWIDVVKADKDNTQKKLEGAVFRFGFGSFNADSNTWTWANTLEADIVSDANGRLAINRPMPPGNYLLQETAAPANYKMPEYMWLLQMVNSATLDPSDPDYNATRPRIIPYITRLGLDGAVVPNTRQRLTINDKDMPGDGSSNVVHTLEGTFPNEKIADFNLTVEKQWEQIQGDDSALADSEIEVVLGRYTLAKRSATLNIVKDGVPENANVIIVYTVDKIDDNNGGAVTRITTVANSTWTGVADQAIGSVPVALTEGERGHFRVTEYVFMDDERYNHTHNQSMFGDSNVKDVYLEEGDSDSVRFTSNYSYKNGDVWLSSILIDSRTQPTVDLDQYKDTVQYTVYDENWNAIGGPLSFNDLTDPSFGDYDPNKQAFNVGTYGIGTKLYIVETGWPNDPKADVIFSHTRDAAQDRNIATVTVVEGDNDVEFETEYHDRVKTDIALVAFNTADPLNEITTVGTWNLPGGMIQIDFMVKPGTTDYTNSQGVGDCVYAGKSTDSSDYVIEWPDGTPDGSQDPDTPVRARLIVPIDSPGGTRNIFIGTSDPVSYTDVTNATAQEYSTGSGGFNSTQSTGGTGTRSLPKSALLNSALQKEMEASGAGAGSDSDTQVTGVINGKTINVITEDMTEAVKDAIDAKSGNTQTKARALKGALRSAANGIKPGNLSINLYWTSDAGPGEPPDPTSTATFVPDSDWNNVGGLGTNHKITLKQSDLDPNNNALWTKTIVDHDEYPAFNEAGERYYYYIREVHETKMPEGTTGQILTDPNDASKQRLAWFLDPVDHDSDPSTPPVAPDPQHLAVSNKVANPADVKLYKVDENDNTILLAGAKFHLQKKDDQNQYQTVKEPDVEALDSSESVTLDTATGIFEVPEHGMTIKGLLVGEYKLVEDECPPGYVMNITEYTFKVNQAGKLTDVDSNLVYDDTVDEFALFIPNPPGSELPHAGGIGTAIYTTVGTLLMAVGALALIRRRREA